MRKRKFTMREILKRQKTPLKKGDLVWFLGSGTPMIGKYFNRNGGYYYIHPYVDGEFIRHSYECYELELMKATDEEVMLWMLEN
jgi:hypothetical protein